MGRRTERKEKAPKRKDKGLSPLTPGAKLFSHSLTVRESGEQEVITETHSIMRVTKSFVFVLKAPDNASGNPACARLPLDALKRNEDVGWRGGRVLTRDPDGARWWRRALRDYT
jgi:hypothetical protein